MKLKGKNLLNYCAGQSLSLTRQTRLKLTLMAEQYGVTPSQLMNVAIESMDAPPGLDQAEAEVVALLTQAREQGENLDKVFRTYLNQRERPTDMENDAES